MPLFYLVLPFCNILPLLKAALVIVRIEFLNHGIYILGPEWTSQQTISYVVLYIFVTFLLHFEHLFYLEQIVTKITSRSNLSILSNPLVMVAYLVSNIIKPLAPKSMVIKAYLQKLVAILENGRPGLRNNSDLPHQVKVNLSISLNPLNMVS